MSHAENPPSLHVPVMSTFAAIVMLVVGLLAASGGAQHSVSLIIFLSVGVVLAAAVAQWVFYFRSYIDYRIEQRFSEK